MCDAYFDSGKYRGPETDPDGWHVRAVLGVNNDENVVIQSQNCNRATATKNKSQSLRLRLKIYYKKPKLNS